MIQDARSLVTNPQGQGGPQDPNQVIGIAVHHTGGGEGAPMLTEAQELAVIKAIDFQHQTPEQPFGGFGYHGITFGSGRSYYCGDGIRAHVRWRNHELRGWVLHGNFVNQLPGPLQMEGLREALESERKKFAFVPASPLPIKGHEEWALPGNGTECPGLLTPRDWEAFLNPPIPPVDIDGWVTQHNQILGIQNNEVVIAIGDWEGTRPGQIAKLFADVGWLWIRRGARRPDGSYDMYFSPEKGD